MTAKASPEVICALHDQIATALTDAIKVFQKEETPEGLKGLAALVNVARQFVKDNEDSLVASRTKPVQNLASVLPFPGNMPGEGEEDDQAATG